MLIIETALPVSIIFMTPFLYLLLSYASPSLYISHFPQCGMLFK